MTAPIWSPDGSRVARANLVRFLAHVRTTRPEGAPDVWDVPSLYAWSVSRPDAFWPAVWRFTDVIAEPRGAEPWDRVVVGLDRMAPPDPVLGPRWFDGARLNFAENLLRHDGDADALVFWNERGR